MNIKLLKSVPLCEAVSELTNLKLYISFLRRYDLLLFHKYNAQHGLSVRRARGAELFAFIVHLVDFAKRHFVLLDERAEGFGSDLLGVQVEPIEPQEHFQHGFRRNLRLNDVDGKGRSMHLLALVHVEFFLILFCDFSWSPLSFSKKTGLFVLTRKRV